jgi:hypothetical protein
MAKIDNPVEAAEAFARITKLEEELESAGERVSALENEKASQSAVVEVLTLENKELKDAFVDKEAKIVELTSDIEIVRKSNEILRQENADLDQGLAAAEEVITAHEATIADLQGQVAAYETEVTDATKKAEESEEDADAVREQLENVAAHLSPKGMTAETGVFGGEQEDSLEKSYNDYLYLSTSKDPKNKFKARQIERTNPRLAAYVQAKAKGESVDFTPQPYGKQLGKSITVSADERKIYDEYMGLESAAGFALKDRSIMERERNRKHTVLKVEARKFRKNRTASGETYGDIIDRVMRADEAVR